MRKTYADPVGGGFLVRLKFEPPLGTLLRVPTRMWITLAIVQKEAAYGYQDRETQSIAQVRRRTRGLVQRSGIRFPCAERCFLTTAQALDIGHVKEGSWWSFFLPTPPMLGFLTDAAKTRSTEQVGR